MNFKLKLISLALCFLLTASFLCACSDAGEYIPSGNDRKPAQEQDDPISPEEPETKSLLSKVFREDAFRPAAYHRGTFTSLSELTGFSLTSSGTGFAVFTSESNGKKVQKIVTAEQEGVYLTLTDTEDTVYGVPSYSDNGAYVTVEKTVSGKKSIVYLVPEGELFSAGSPADVKVFPRSDGGYLYLINGKVMATVMLDPAVKSTYREKEPTYSVHRADISSSVYGQSDLSSLADGTFFVTPTRFILRENTAENEIRLTGLSLPDLAPVWERVFSFDSAESILSEGFTTGAFLLQYERTQMNEEGPYSYERGGNRYLIYTLSVDLTTGKVTNKAADFLFDSIFNPVISMTLYRENRLCDGIAAIAEINRIDPSAHYSVKYMTPDQVVLNANGTVSYSIVEYDNQNLEIDSFDGTFWTLRTALSTYLLIDKYGEAVLKTTEKSFPYGCVERDGKLYSVYGELAIDPIIPEGAEVVADKEDVCRVLSLPTENGKKLSVLYGGKLFDIATSFEKVEAGDLFAEDLIAVTAGGKTVLRALDGTFLGEMPAGLSAQKTLAGSSHHRVSLLKDGSGNWYLYA